MAARGANVYEHLLACQQRGLGFVGRACQDRKLVGTAQTVWVAARSQSSAGHFALPLRPRAGKAARQATLQVSCSAVVGVQTPKRPSASPGKGPAVAVGLVRVWEAGGEAEWVLLRDDPIASFAQAWEKAWHYAPRWLIEEFHKALKTGLGAERLQLRTARRLFVATALLSVVALALVDLRERSRQQPDAPAEQAGLPARCCVNWAGGRCGLFGR